MLDNHVYNLMEQILTEHKSLWRIKKMYLDDAKDCQVCTDFWNKMIEDKQEHIEELLPIIKDHLSGS